ncbi:hypothetical protein BH11MYX2_BH11MYX2_10400 [soil metagenome]|jgi:hypothetical protein
MPKNYVFETVIIALVLIVVMVVFLKHSWGG